MSVCEFEGIAGEQGLRTSDENFAEGFGISDLKDCEDLRIKGMSRAEKGRCREFGETPTLRKAYTGQSDMLLSENFTSLHLQVFSSVTINLVS